MSSSTLPARYASWFRNESTADSLCASGKSDSAAIQFAARVETVYGCHASPLRGGLAAIHASIARLAAAGSPARAWARTSSP
jgi:hypothetical protein